MVARQALTQSESLETLVPKGGCHSIVPEDARISAEIRHKNALGYTIQAAGSRYDSGATIMVGKDDAGKLVSIASVSRGGTCGLKCDCGAPLIAKKGDERVHHFAHEAGSTAECAVARDAALGRFAIQALSDGSLLLPDTVHKLKELTVVAKGFEIANGIVRINGKFKERWFYIYLATRIRQSKAIRQQCLSPDVRSALLIDLSKFRHMTDKEIQIAIGSGAPRYWIYNKSQRDLDILLDRSRSVADRWLSRKKVDLPASTNRTGQSAAASFDSVVAGSSYLAEVAARRLSDAIRIYSQHRPDIAPDFADIPLSCLSGMTPRQYNERRSDIVPRIERDLGLRDAAGRPIKV